MNPFYSTTNLDQQQSTTTTTGETHATQSKTNALVKVQEHMHGLGRYTPYRGSDLFAPQFASNYFRTCHSSGSQRIILKHLMAEGIVDWMWQWNDVMLMALVALDARTKQKAHTTPIYTHTNLLAAHCCVYNSVRKPN